MNQIIPMRLTKIEPKQQKTLLDKIVFCTNWCKAKINPFHPLFALEHHLKTNRARNGNLKGVRGGIGGDLKNVIPPLLTIPQFVFLFSPSPWTLWSNGRGEKVVNLKAIYLPCPTLQHASLSCVSHADVARWILEKLDPFVGQQPCLWIRLALNEEFINMMPQERENGGGESPTFSLVYSPGVRGLL